MRLSDILKISLKALGRNKMRTFLTMLGIIIGISSVIIMMSLGASLSSYMSDTFSSFGSNSISITPAWNRESGYWERLCAMDQLDYDALRQQCKHVAYVSPVERMAITCVNGSRSCNPDVSGVSEAYLPIGNVKLAHGRWFDAEDVATSNKVCVVGQTVVRDLFGNDENPVGRTIRCGDQPMQIIGVLKPMGKTLFFDQDNMLYIPYTTVMRRFQGITSFSDFEAVPHSMGEVEIAVSEIKRVMRQIHGVGKGEPDVVEVSIAQDQLESLTRVLNIVSLVLALIAGISLIVGGVGIMNIMYVTVTERTREIGIRMAVGARQGDILRQFLTESVVLSLVGGIIGILIGFGLSYVITYFAKMPFVVSGTALVVSFGVSTFIGVFFGWYPAKRAANLDPIDAIRYE